MPEGLTREEAAKKLEEHEPNEIEKGEETGKLDLLLEQFSNVLVWILIAAAAISFFTGGMVEFYFILFIIGVIVAMGFFQEWKAEEAIEELKEMATVLFIEAIKKFSHRYIDTTYMWKIKTD